MTAKLLAAGYSTGLTCEETQMQINGETTYSNVYLDKTLYTGPYLVMTEHEYTKHYFIEGERVCSKVGGGFGPAQVPPTSEPLEFIDGDEDEIAIRLHHLVHRNIDCTGYSGEWEIHSGLEPAHHDTNDPEYRQYFYHPDHLGSSSFITEKHGEAEQHLQYLPFGELFTSQRNHNFDARYKFSAKELDDESGYTYFGARYYDPELSNWLSVDPMAKERPSLSPYNYVQWNPLNRVDPTGMLDDDFYFDQDGKLLRYIDNDKPDRVFIAKDNVNVDKSDPGMVPEPEYEQVDMSSAEIEQKMGENGFRKVDSKILKAEFTRTSSSGKLNVSSSKAIEVTLDTKYTKKQNKLIDSRALEYYKYEPEIGPFSSTSISKRELIYGEKTSGNKFIDIMIKINSINSGNLNLTPINHRYNSMDALPEKYNFLKEY